MVSTQNPGPFVETFSHIYERLSAKPLPGALGDFPQTMFGGPDGILPGLSPYLEMLYKFAGQAPPLCRVSLSARVEEAYLIPRNNKTLVAFSAGKDSVVAALLAQQAGREVTLFYVAGINIAYSNERAYAKRLAAALNMPLIEKEICGATNGDYAENPVKNQLILALMVEQGLAMGCTEFCFGDYPGTTLADTNIDFNLSDSAECYALLKEFYQSYIPSYRDYFPVTGVTQAYLSLANMRPDILAQDQTSSCIMPVYRRPNLRLVNMRKYGVDLEAGRCGSCQKCACEYIHKVILKAAPLNPDFFQHAANVLRARRFEDAPGAHPEDFKATPENEIISYWVNFDVMRTIPGYESFDDKRQTLLDFLRTR